MRMKLAHWQVRSEDACRQQCSACSGCSFISSSAAYGDCSWFRQCDLQALKQLDPGDDMRMISNTFKTHYIKEPSPRRWPQKPSSTTTSYDYTNEFKQVPGSWAQSVNLRPLVDGARSRWVSDDVPRPWLEHWELDHSSVFKQVAQW